MMPGNPTSLAEALGKRVKNMSTTKAVKEVNPLYDGEYVDYSENCQRVVVALEARFRGYDVIASPTYKGDTAPNSGNWLKYFENAKSEYVGHTTANATQRALENKMKEYGDGARAVMRLKWKRH